MWWILILLASLRYNRNAKRKRRKNRHEKKSPSRITGTFICIDWGDFKESRRTVFHENYGRYKSVHKKVICIIDTRSCLAYPTAANFFTSSSKAFDMVFCLGVPRRMRESFLKNPR